MCGGVFVRGEGVCVYVCMCERRKQEDSIDIYRERGERRKREERQTTMTVYVAIDRTRGCESASKAKQREMREGGKEVDR